MNYHVIFFSYFDQKNMGNQEKTKKEKLHNILIKLYWDKKPSEINQTVEDIYNLFTDENEIKYDIHSCINDIINQNSHFELFFLSNNRYKIKCAIDKMLTKPISKKESDNL